MSKMLTSIHLYVLDLKFTSPKIVSYCLYTTVVMNAKINEQN